ncbi:MAG TPA: uroporphyrinogen decarboxylase family protein [Planctomycetota bacterium]|nr:uroporphyrinogen decarboxylase family protein [Planctomycetota bacterium]
MTPRERLLRTMRGERADRVPLVLPRLHFASRERLAKAADPLQRRLAERIFDEVHFDVGVPAPVNRMLVTPPQRISTRTEALANGHTRHHGTIDTPKGPLTFLTEWAPESATTWTIKHPVETREEIEKIASVPWELPRGLAAPKLDDLPAGFAERGVVRTGVSSPFVCVAGMMPRQWFLELCLTDLPLIQELTETCRQRILACLEVLFSKPGVEYVWIGGSEWVTPPMASPRIYDALVQEQERSLIEFVHARSNAVVHIHCHGKVRRALQRTIERGADFTEPVEPPPDGDITMAEAKALAAGRITLGGNIEARVLCNESEEAVERAVLAAFDGGTERFVLHPTDGPSPCIGEREFRNYERMISVWERLSPM